VIDSYCLIDERVNVLTQFLYIDNWHMLETPDDCFTTQWHPIQRIQFGDWFTVSRNNKTSASFNLLQDFSPIISKISHGHFSHIATVLPVIHNSALISTHVCRVSTRDGY